MTTNKDNVLARIRALAAKTTANGCTEAEAKAAAEMVDRLLEQYELTLDEVAVTAQASVEMIDIEGYGRHMVKYAAMAIGKFCDAKVWLSNKKADLSYLGTEVDIEICQYLTLMFARSLDREASNYTMFNSGYAMADDQLQRQMLQSFQVGMADRLSERLGELKSKRDLTMRENGRALTIAKAPLIQAALNELGIVIGQGSGGRMNIHRGSYEAGKSAGDKVSIGAGVSHAARTSGSLR